MKIIFCETSDYDLLFFCPLCKKITKGEECLQNDDYVSTNCLISCDNCNEILLCMTGYNFELENKNEYSGFNCDYNKLLTEGINSELYSKCTKHISKETAEKYIIEYVSGQLVNEYKLFLDSGINFYVTGILYIKEVSYCNHCELIDTVILPKNMLCFKHIYDNFNQNKSMIEHDGNHLHYSSVCSECNNEYKAYIWGD